MANYTIESPLGVIMSVRDKDGPEARVFVYCTAIVCSLCDGETCIHVQLVQAANQGPISPLWDEFEWQEHVCQHE